MGPLAGVGDPDLLGYRAHRAGGGRCILRYCGQYSGTADFLLRHDRDSVGHRWYGFKYGYEKGTQIVGEAGGNTLQKITQGASVMGLFVMGSLVYRWTTINIPLKLTEYEQNGKNVEVTVQS